MANRIIRTVCLKLRDPSPGKRRKLLATMQLAHEGYWDAARTLEPSVSEGPRAARVDSAKVSGWLRQHPVYRRLPSATRDGIAFDLAQTWHSHAALETEFCADDPVDSLSYEETLAQLCGSVLSLEDENKLVWALKREHRSPIRPLSFVRARDFLDEHELKGEREPSRLAIGIHVQGEKRTERVWVPLEFGARQYWKWMSGFAGSQAKAARLVWRADTQTFQLHVQVELARPEPIETVAWLGIDRGVMRRAAWAVIDKGGNLLDWGLLGEEVRQAQATLGRRRAEAQQRGKRPDRSWWRKAGLAQHVGETAQALSALAREHQARVVLEDLHGLRTVGKHTRSEYERLSQTLAWRCEELGLPKPFEVWASGTSLRCHVCGEKGERKDREFQCPVCGWQGDADLNAAVNIAERGRQFRAKRTAARLLSGAAA